MLWGGHSGGLEVRADTGGALRLAGRFPYGAEAVLSDAGRPLKETFAPRAFAGRLNAGGEVHFLMGHNYDRPIASRGAGTLELTDGDDALAFEARISPEAARLSWVQDLRNALDAGLILGLSPGFRVERRSGAERIEEVGDSTLRTVVHADLFELSAVTRPAYDGAQIEARNWTPDDYCPMWTVPSPWRYR